MLVAGARGFGLAASSAARSLNTRPSSSHAMALSAPPSTPSAPPPKPTLRAPAVQDEPMGEPLSQPPRLPPFPQGRRGTAAPVYPRGSGGLFGRRVCAATRRLLARRPNALRLPCAQALQRQSAEFPLRVILQAARRRSRARALVPSPRQGLLALLASPSSLPSEGRGEKPRTAPLQRERLVDCDEEKPGGCLFRSTGWGLAHPHRNCLFGSRKCNQAPKH